MPIPDDDRAAMTAFLQLLPLTEQQRTRAMVVADQGGRAELALGVLPNETRATTLSRWRDYVAGWHARGEYGKRTDDEAMKIIRDAARYLRNPASLTRVAQPVDIAATIPGRVIPSEGSGS